jgi:hypothetical protein
MNLQADSADRRSARESNSVPLPTKEVCCRNTCRPVGWESSRQDSNLRYPVCKTGVFAARRRDDLRPVARVGVEPTGTRLRAPPEGWSWPRCRLAYRAVNAGSCGSGSRTSASERMKLGRAPAHPQSQAPVPSRADRPHEGQPGTCLAWENCLTDRSVAGGRFELPRLGGTCV